MVECLRTGVRFSPPPPLPHNRTSQDVLFFYVYQIVTVTKHPTTSFRITLHNRLLWGNNRLVTPFFEKATGYSDNEGMAFTASGQMGTRSCKASLVGTGKGRPPLARKAQQKPISENTINAALRRLGYTKDQMTGHGFRAMARTLLDEELGFPPDIIEHQLAHKVRDPLGRAYNRTQHLEARRKMMQAWADYLDELRKTKLLVNA